MFVIKPIILALLFAWSVQCWAASHEVHSMHRCKNGLRRSARDNRASVYDGQHVQVKHGQTPIESIKMDVAIGPREMDNIMRSNSKQGAHILKRDWSSRERPYPKFDGQDAYNKHKESRDVIRMKHNIERLPISVTKDMNAVDTSRTRDNKIPTSSFQREVRAAKGCKNNVKRPEYKFHTSLFEDQKERNNKLRRKAKRANNFIKRPISVTNQMKHVAARVSRSSDRTISRRNLRRSVRSTHNCRKQDGEDKSVYFSRFKRRHKSGTPEAVTPASGAEEKQFEYREADAQRNCNDMQQLSDPTPATHDNTEYKYYNPSEPDGTLETQTNCNLETQTNYNLETQTNYNLETQTNCNLETQTNYNVETQTTANANQLSETKPATNDEPGHKYYDQSEFVDNMSTFYNSPWEKPPTVVLETKCNASLHDRTNHHHLPQIITQFISSFKKDKHKPVGGDAIDADYTPDGVIIPVSLGVDDINYPREVQRNTNDGSYDSPDHWDPKTNDQQEDDLYKKQEDDLYKKQEDDLYKKQEDDLYKKPEDDLHKKQEDDLYKKPEDDLYKKPEDNIYTKQEDNMYTKEEENNLYNQQEDIADNGKELDYSKKREQVNILLTKDHTTRVWWSFLFIPFVGFALFLHLFCYHSTYLIHEIISFSIALFVVVWLIVFEIMPFMD